MCPANRPRVWYAGCLLSVFLRRLIQFRSKNQMDFFGSDQSFVRHRADFHPVPDFCPHQQFAEFFLQKLAMSFCVRTRPCEMKAYL